MTVASPSLYRLASQRKYAEFLERFASHAEDVVWTDRYGNTALHVLCRAQQSDDTLKPAIEAIIQVKPELIQQPNSAGLTPMHHAASRRLCIRPSSVHTEILLLLIETCPGAVSIARSTGFNRVTPFHIASEANADIEILKRMLQVNPQLATKPCVEKEAYAMSENPLQLLWKAGSIVYLQEQRSGDLSGLWTDSAFVNITDKMSLLLLTAYHGQVVDPSTNQWLLHAACCQRVPRNYISYLLSQDEIRQQASVADERGNLPLHYAVATATIESQMYTQFLIESLLEVYPQAASVPDAHGQLPLHVALDSHMSWHRGGVRELVYAYPMGLVTRDEATNLYPFMSSAPRAISSRLHLSTTYELLRAAPDMVKAGISTE